MTHRTIHTLLALALAACGGSSEPAAEYPPMDDPEPTSTTTVEAVGDTGPTTPPAPPVQVVASESTPIEGAMPQVRIRAPRNGQTIRRGPVMLNLQVRNWALAPDPGNHVHVIVDNEPYIAVRDVAAGLHVPVEPDALAGEIGEPIRRFDRGLHRFGDRIEDRQLAQVALS